MDRLSDNDLRSLLTGILKAYEESGEDELATRKLGQFLIARYGSVTEGKAALGGLDRVKTAFREMQARLYQE